MGKPVESADERERNAFKLNIYRQFGTRLFHVHDQGRNGQIMHHDPDEIMGEVPGIEMPGQLLFDNKEINPPSQRLKDLIKSVQPTGKRVVIMSTIAGIGVAIGIGTFYALRHYIDKNPQADITDKYTF